MKGEQVPSLSPARETATLSRNERETVPVPQREERVKIS